MLIEKNTDLLEVRRGIIIHGCNCQSKYRSGVAGQVRDMYPQAYESYMRYEPKKLGRVDWCCVDQDAPLYVLNAFTQVFYGRDGKRYADPEAIRTALLEAGTAPFLSRENHFAIHSSRIGCQLGGLSWEEVKPIYMQVAEKLDVLGVDIVVHFVAK